MTQTAQPMRPDVISLADEERVNDVVLGEAISPSSAYPHGSGSF